MYFKIELENICLCSLEKFISNFSFQEYIIIKESDNLSDDLIYSRLESVITEIMNDSNINL